MTIPARAPLLLLAVAAFSPEVARAQIIIQPPTVVIRPPMPHVVVRPRVRWGYPRAQVVVSPAPPPVWIAPAPPSPPPPPVYIAPPPLPPPAYAYPQPVYVVTPPPQAVVVARPAAPAAPQWDARFGLGATAEGTTFVRNGNGHGFGVLGQLRYRAARHFVLELQGGYERTEDRSGFVRTDVPVTAGMMVPILGPEFRVSPYFTLAAGMSFAQLRLLDAPTMEIDDKRTQVVAQAGCGLEVRLGRHFAIHSDLRADGRFSVNQPSEAVAATTSVNGKPVQPIQNTLSLRLSLGGTIYF